MTTYTVCKESELPVGSLKAVKAGETKLVVYHLEEGFYATQHSCTHMFAPLGRGKLVETCQVQCPLHRARFDVRTGEVIQWANFPPGVQMLNFVRGEKALQTYPVSVHDGEVRVDL